MNENIEWKTAYARLRVAQSRVAHVVRGHICKRLRTLDLALGDVLSAAAGLTAGTRVVVGVAPGKVFVRAARDNERGWKLSKPPNGKQLRLRVPGCVVGLGHCNTYKSVTLPAFAHADGILEIDVTPLEAKQ